MLRGPADDNRSVVCIDINHQREFLTDARAVQDDGNLDVAASVLRQPNGRQHKKMLTDRARGACSIAHTGPR